jgi:hypothetical protein
LNRHCGKKHPDNEESKSSLNLHDDKKIMQLSKKLGKDIGDRLLNMKSSKERVNYYVDDKIPKEYGDTKEEYDKQFPEMESTGNPTNTSMSIAKLAMWEEKKKGKYEEEFPALGGNKELVLESKEVSRISKASEMREVKELVSVESITNDFANIDLDTKKEITPKKSKKKSARKKKKRE